MDKIDLFRAFFTSESRYYVSILDKYENGKRFSFNFWAGLLGLIWFCYRKLYIESIVIFFALTIFSILESSIVFLLIPNAQTYAVYNKIFIYTIDFFVLGILGNTLYLKKAKKVVDKFLAKPNNLIYNIELSELRKRGGTSIIAAVICTIIVFSVEFIYEYLIQAY